jgi:hypothetical protein
MDVELELDSIGTLFVTTVGSGSDRLSVGLYDGAGFFPLTDQERRYLGMGCRVWTTVDAGLLEKLTTKGA